MKRAAWIFGLTFAAAFVATTATAADTSILGSEQRYRQAEASLLMGLASDNLGVRESAAYLLGELKSERAVLPLMAMLKNDTQPSSRIVAALALCRIGDGRGVYAVKTATKFDSAEEVQLRCAWFYDQYVHPGSFGFVPPQEGAGALASR